MKRRHAYLAKAQESAQYDPRSGKPHKSLEEVLSRYRVLPNGCHEWTGTRNKFGYGLVCLVIDGKATTMATHRLQWMRFNGPLLGAEEALHDCPDGNDNRACINIDHLWKGTQLDNIHDMIAKGRHNFGGLKYSGESAQNQARANNPPERK